MALVTLTERHAVAREARPLNSLLNPWLTFTESCLNKHGELSEQKRDTESVVREVPVSCRRLPHRGRAHLVLKASEEHSLNAQSTSAMELTTQIVILRCCGNTASEERHREGTTVFNTPA